VTHIAVEVVGRVVVRQKERSFKAHFRWFIAVRRYIYNIYYSIVLM